MTGDRPKKGTSQRGSAAKRYGQSLAEALSGPPHAGADHPRCWDAMSRHTGG